MAFLQPIEHPVVALRRAILACGFQPIAVYTDQKRPFGESWQRTRGMPPFASVALNTGILCNVVRCVDVDIDDPEEAERAAKIIEEEFGPSSMVRRRGSSPRRAILYRGVGRKRIIRLKSGKIEVLGEGQMFVAYGRHPDGDDFEWPFDEPARNHA